MSKIVLIAPGTHIAKYAHQLKAQLKKPQELEIVNTQMENAINYAKKQFKDNVDVIIARGNTAKMLKESKLSFPIVTIPITDFEIIDAIKKAQKKVHKPTPCIGYIGLEDVISKIRYFLETLNLKVNLYTVENSEDIERSILEAQKDQVDVLIGGIYTCKLLEKKGISHVLLESSLSSVQSAYERAKEVQRNINIQKKKLKEKNIILDSVFDAIISINQKGKITLMNKVAESFFNMRQEEVVGRSYSIIFKEQEKNIIQKVLTSKEKVLGQVIELNNKQYALGVNPVLISKRNTGAIISLHEINNIQQIENTVRKRLHEMDHNDHYTFDNIRGISFEIQKTIITGKKYSKADANILIIGEPGTGRTTLAKSIHNAGQRKKFPFVSVDCSTLTVDTIQHDLFGSASALSAEERIPGLFELAHGGTLYLAEIPKLNILGQAKLLQVLKDMQIRPIGSRKIIPVNIRILASCSENLYHLMQQGAFQKDLYYLLSTLCLPVPALRQRKGDITYLANYFIEESKNKFKKNIYLSTESTKILEQFNWEGNITQLKAFCERLVLLSADECISPELVQEQLNDHLYFEHLGVDKISSPLPVISKDLSGFVINQKRVTAEELKQLESFYGGNRTLMAKKLGISRSTLWKYMKMIAETPQ